MTVIRIRNSCCFTPQKNIFPSSLSPFHVAGVFAVSWSKHFIYEPNEAQDVSELWNPSSNKICKQNYCWKCKKKTKWKYCSILLINFFSPYFIIRRHFSPEKKKRGEKGRNDDFVCVQEKKWVAVREFKVENMKWAIMFCNETISRRKFLNEELRLVLIW